MTDPEWSSEDARKMIAKMKKNTRERAEARKRKRKAAGDPPKRPVKKKKKTKKKRKRKRKTKKRKTTNVPEIAAVAAVAAAPAAAAPSQGSGNNLDTNMSPEDSTKAPNETDDSPTSDSKVFDMEVFTPTMLPVQQLPAVNKTATGKRKAPPSLLEPTSTVGHASLPSHSHPMSSADDQKSDRPAKRKPKCFLYVEYSSDEDSDEDTETQPALGRLKDDRNYQDDNDGDYMDISEDMDEDIQEDNQEDEDDLQEDSNSDSDWEGLEYEDSDSLEERIDYCVDEEYATPPPKKRRATPSVPRVEPVPPMTHVPVYKDSDDDYSDGVKSDDSDDEDFLPDTDWKEDKSNDSDEECVVLETAAGNTNPRRHVHLPVVTAVPPVARMPTNVDSDDDEDSVDDVVAQARAAAAAAMARTSPVAQNPTEMLQRLQETPTAYGTRRDKQAHNRMENIVNEFLAYQAKQDSTRDWTTKEAWEDTNDGMGCFLAAFILWAMWKRRPTLGYLTLMAKDMKAAYTEARKRFPGWCELVDPAEGVQYVKKRSVAYTTALKSLNRIFIGRTADVKRANPMFLSDIRRFRDCMTPNPAGFRNVALLYVMHETGARGIAFTRGGTGSPRYNPRTQRYTVYYKAQKRRGNDMSVRACVLSKEASEIFGLYWKSRKYVEYTHPHLMFGLISTESIDQMLDKLCRKAGYPHRYFSSHSLRAGALTNAVCQALLDGTAPGVAQMNARVLGDFGVNSDALRSYIRPMTDEIEDFQQEVNHMSELTVEQLHPDLDGRLKGPFRSQRPNKGLVQHPEVMEQVREMLTILQQDGDLSVNQLTARTKTEPGANTAHLTALVLRIRRAGLLHEDLWECAKKMAGKKPRDYDIRKHVGYLLRVMVVTGDLTPSMLRETPPRMPVPSKYLVKHFNLKKFPKNYKQIQQPKPTFDCGSSSDLTFLVEHYKNRQTGRGHPVVYVGNKEYEYDKLTVEQLAMVQQRSRYRVPIDPTLFEALAVAEDEAYEQEGA